MWSGHIVSKVIYENILTNLNCCLDFLIFDSFHYEQPEVKHLNELIVLLQTDIATIQVGTTRELNNMLSGQYGRAGSIDIEHVDTNRDGKPESIDINLDIQGVDPTSIKSVVIVQSVSYGIRVSKDHLH